MNNRSNLLRITFVPFALLFLLAVWGLYATLARAGNLSLQAAQPAAQESGPTPTATPTPAPCDPTPTFVQSPNGGGPQNRLRGITAISPNDIWAVGFYQESGFFKTLTLHWDGTQWTLVNSPNGGNDDNYLYGVTAFASNDVWAVGESAENPASSSTTLVLHWNGSSWNTVSAPSPGQFNTLYEVSGASSGDIWAVGIQHNGTAGSERTLALHWDGTQWAESQIPDYGTGANFVTDVEAIASNNVRAVGYAFEPSFGGFRTRIWRWDGSSWAAETSPNPVTQGNNTVLAISASSANDIWAVGYSGDITNTSTVMRYDGSAWALVDFPIDPPGANSLLRGVYAISPSDVWVIGDYGTDHLTARWDGSAWHRIFDPVYDELFDITAASSSVVWSVGHDARFTLTIRYTYPCPPGTPSPTPTGMASATRTRTATPIVTSSATVTLTPTRTQTATRTATGVATSAATATATVTSVATHVATQTGTIVASSTPVDTATSTATATATATPTHCALMFQDVPEGSTFYEFIRCMACQGIVTGYPCGGPGEPCGTTGDPYFRPNSNVTRGQITKIVANSAGFTEPVSGQTFEDVVPGSTFYEFVQRLTDREIMTGYPCGNPEPCVPPDNRPYFRPGANATRGQLAKIVSNAAKIQDPVSGQTFEDVLPGSTFYEFIERLVARGVMSGYVCGAPEPCVPPDNRPYFRPANNVTRGQTSKIVANTFFPGCEPPR